MRTADYNEAKQLGLLQQQRTQADGGEPEDASFGNASYAPRAVPVASSSSSFCSTAVLSPSP